MRIVEVITKQKGSTLLRTIPKEFPDFLPLIEKIVTSGLFPNDVPLEPMEGEWTSEDLMNNYEYYRDLKPIPFIGLFDDGVGFLLPGDRSNFYFYDTGEVSENVDWAFVGKLIKAWRISVANNIEYGKELFAKRKLRHNNKNFREAGTLGDELLKLSQSPKFTNFIYKKIRVLVSRKYRNRNDYEDKIVTGLEIFKNYLQISDGSNRFITIDREDPGYVLGTHLHLDYEFDRKRFVKIEAAHYNSSLSTVTRTKFIKRFVNTMISHLMVRLDDYLPDDESTKK